MKLTQQKIEEKVDHYLHFNGIGISSAQREKVIRYLLDYAHDEEILECEMICEIRTLNGD